MSALAPSAERYAIREALPALALLAAYLYGRGLLYMLDYFVRALFGTLTRSVGWIPILGRVATVPIHKIEQKVSHLIGTATHALDKRIGTSFHKLAWIARHMGSTLAQQAFMGLLIAATLANFITHGYFVKFLRAVIHPLRALQHLTDARLHALRRMVRAIDGLVLHKVWPQLRALEAAMAHTLDDVIPGLRAGERWLERDLARLRRWVRHRRISLTTGAFIGALVWALGRLGIGWIRCSNVKRVGRALCRAPSSRIDALLALLAGALVLANLRDLARFAEAVEHDAARGVAELVGVATRASGQFTIE